MYVSSVFIMDTNMKNFVLSDRHYGFFCCCFFTCTCTFTQSFVKTIQKKMRNITLCKYNFPVIFNKHGHYLLVICNKQLQFD